MLFSRIPCLTSVKAVINSSQVFINPISSLLSHNLQLNTSLTRSATTVAHYRRRHVYRKFRGLKFSDGAEVLTGDALLTQNGLNFYPGENVISYFYFYCNYI